MTYFPSLELAELMEAKKKIDEITNMSNAIVSINGQEKTIAVLESPKTGEYVDRIYSLFSNQPRSMWIVCKIVGHLAAKMLISTACAVSAFSSVNASKENFDNIVLKNIYGYGNALVTALFSICFALQLYHDFAEKETFQKNRDTTVFLVHWTAVVLFALLSELPLAYTSYYYNKETLFWSIYTPLITSFFAMESNNELFNERFKKDNFLIKPFLSSHELKLVAAQGNVCKLIGYAQSSLNENPNKIFANKLETIHLHSDDKKVIVSELVLQILKIGLTKAKEDSSSTPIMIKLSEKGVQIISSILPFGSPIVDGILIYKGFQLISNQNWAIPLIIIVSVGPGLYLQVRLTQKFYLGIFRKLLSLQKCQQKISCNEVASFIAKCTFIAIMTFFGMGPDISVARDHVGYRNVFTVLISISMLSTMAILFIMSMNSIANKFGGVYRQLKGRTVEEITHHRCIQKVENFEDFIQSLSTEEFEKCMKEIDFDDATITMLSEKDLKKMISSDFSFKDNDIETTQIELD